MQFAFPHHPHSSEVVIFINLVPFVVKEAETVRLPVECLPFELHCHLLMTTVIVPCIRISDLYGALEPPECIAFAQLKRKMIHELTVFVLVNVLNSCLQVFNIDWHFLLRIDSRLF